MSSIIDMLNNCGIAVSVLPEDAFLLYFLQEIYRYKVIIDTTFLDKWIFILFNSLTFLFINFLILCLLLTLCYFKKYLSPRLVNLSIVILYFNSIFYLGLIYYLYAMLVNIKFLTCLNNSLLNHLKVWCLEMGLYINYLLKTLEQPSLEFSPDWVGVYKSCDTASQGYIYLGLCIAGGINCIFTGGLVRLIQSQKLYWL